jgi:hypothetical protein
LYTENFKCWQNFLPEIIIIEFVELLLVFINVESRFVETLALLLASFAFLGFEELFNIKICYVVTFIINEGIGSVS